jgi:phosphoribosylaminoimidazole carboxylase
MKVGASSMLNILGASSSSDAIRSLVRTSLGVPGATVHMYGKAESRKGRKMGHITVVGSTDAEVRTRLEPLLAALPDPDKPTPATRTGHSHPHPLVSIIMGSDSDLPVMSAASAILEQLGIPHELEVVSAHRTPLLMTDFAQAALERGVRCIIAGAGGAAHLPGMVAALTSLPVIGVPVKGSTLDGVDSLHSIVQMPVRLSSPLCALT